MKFSLRQDQKKNQTNQITRLMISSQKSKTFNKQSYKPNPLPQQKNIDINIFNIQYIVPFPPKLFEYSSGWCRFKCIINGLVDANLPKPPLETTIWHKLQVALLLSSLRTSKNCQTFDILSICIKEKQQLVELVY